MKSVYIYLIVLPLAIILFDSCGKNDVTNPNIGCGISEERNIAFLNGEYTNTFVDASGFRVFQFDMLGSAEIISGICTLEEPPAYATATLNEDPTDPVIIALKVLTGPTVPYYTFGTKVHGTGTNTTWSGHIDVGLQQEYGKGPGSVLSIYTELSFPTRGSLPQDSTFLHQINFKTSLTLEYHQYVGNN